MIAGSNAAEASRERETAYVAVTAGGQTFGLPIDRVHDVFVARAVTPVPLAPPEVLGLINLRGQVVTAICLRRRLGLADRPAREHGMTIGLDHRGEAFGLAVDTVGEVVMLRDGARYANPAHLDPRWTAVARAADRLDGDLLVVLDVDAVVSFPVGAGRRPEPSDIMELLS